MMLFHQTLFFHVLVWENLNVQTKGIRLREKKSLVFNSQRAEPLVRDPSCSFGEDGKGGKSVSLANYGLGLK